MNHRMRICLIASLYDHARTGGAERQTIQQAAGFVAAGHHVDVITLAEPEQEETRYATADGVIVHRIALHNLYFPFDDRRRAAPLRAAWHTIDICNPAMGASLRRKLREVAPDIVVTHKLQGLSIAAWRACAALDLCLVHALHDHELVCPATAMTRGERLCETPCFSCATMSTVRHALAPSPFAVIGPSRSIIERHHRYGWFRDIARMAVMPNALPTDWPDATPRTRCPTPLRVGFIGRLEAAKGIDTLLEAAALLPPGLVALRIAGDGHPPYVDALKQRFADSVDAAFLGPTRAAAFYPDIDLLVVPSRAHESFCNVVMEAASLGIPSIVSDRGALPERIDGGRYGWCFPAGDAVTLSRLLAARAEDPVDLLQVGQRALETRAQHTYRHTIDTYLATLSGWLDEFRGARPA